MSHNTRNNTLFVPALTVNPPQPPFFQPQTPNQLQTPTNVQSIQITQLQEIIVKLDPQTALQIVLSQLTTVSKQLDEARAENKILSQDLSIKINNEMQLNMMIEHLKQDKEKLE